MFMIPTSISSFQMLQHTKHAESLASVQLKYFEVTLLSVEGSAAVGLAALGSSLGMHISTVHADAFVNVNEGRISLSRQNLRVRAAWILSLFSLPFCRCLASGRLNHLHYCSPHDPSCLPSLHWQEVFNTGLGSRARQFQRKNMPLTALITSVRLTNMHVSQACAIPVSPMLFEHGRGISNTFECGSRMSTLHPDEQGRENLSHELPRAGRPLRVGDTVGAAWDRDAQSLFFTINGTQLPTVCHSLLVARIHSQHEGLGFRVWGLDWFGLSPLVAKFMHA